MSRPSIFALLLLAGCIRNPDDSSVPIDSSSDASGTDDVEPLQCGESMVCDDPSEVCIEDVEAPACVALDDPTAECAEGQTKAPCGDPPVDCCCDPTPPSTFRCVSSSVCLVEPDCSCLQALCAEDLECVATGLPVGRSFRCQPPTAD